MASCLRQWSELGFLDLYSESLMNAAAVIVAAGSSRRAGFDKLMVDLGGKCVLRRSADVFLSSPRIGELVIVTTEERFREAFPDLDFLPIPVRRVDGGNERHWSVLNGLNALSDAVDLVAIHDGARPLLSEEQLNRCLDAAWRSGAAASARPIVDTLKRADAEGRTLAEAIDRDGLWAMETPQIFRVELVRLAYERVVADHRLVTDEVSALEVIGQVTQLVPNDSPNLKITLPGDLKLAEMIWERRNPCG